MKLYLVLGGKQPKKSKRNGPIFIDGPCVTLNVIDGFARQYRLPSSREPFPRMQPCDVCRAPFLAHGGNSAYCSKECQRARRAEREGATWAK